MIITGRTSLNSSIGSGTFHCPRCSMPRQFQHIEVKRYFTLYFIPLFPLGSSGQYVECTSCTGTFGVEALSAGPTAPAQPAAPSWDDLRRSLVVLLHNAQRVDAETLGRLRTWYEQQSQCTLAPETIATELRQAAEAGARVEAFVQQTLGGVEENGKIYVLESGRDLLKQNGWLGNHERATLRNMARGLSIPVQVVETTLAR